MRRGTKPKPEALLVVEGGRLRRERRLAAPGPRKDKTGAVGSAPADWGDDLRRAWEELTTAAPAGLLTAADRALVEVVARQLVAYRRAPEPSPAMAAELRRGLGELCLTPQERARFAPPEPKKDNPFAHL